MKKETKRSRENELEDLYKALDLVTNFHEAVDGERRPSVSYCSTQCG